MRLGAHRPAAARSGPGGFELALVLDESAIAAAYERAIATGCDAIKPPTKMPWGQTVAYVGDLNGAIIELCTPTGG